MNKTVLITGSSSGIGKATAETFAKAGWNVAATSRSTDPGKFTDYTNIKTYILDVTDNSSVQKAFEEVKKDYGSIDVVVNNAGYGLEGVFEELSEQQIKQQFETNVFGLMNVTRKAIEVMKPQKGGKIIQVSSMGGRVTFPLYSIYHSSKWAVEGFSESLQFELRQFGIQIKLIEPGVIKTKFYDNDSKLTTDKPDLGYKTFKEKVEPSSKQAGSKGANPEKVAKTILKAANSKSNRMRYTVASPSPLLLFLRKILPDRAFLAIIRANYKI